MTHYDYTALQFDNTILRGQVAAWTKRGATSALRKQHLTVVTVRPTPTTSKWRKYLPTHVSSFDRIVFTRNLLTMLKAGMTISEALASTREQMSNIGFQKIISSIEQSIQAGQPMSAGLKRAPGVFNAEYVAIITIGERSGKLVDVLAYLSKKLEDEHRLLRRIRQALTYPAIILVTMLIIVSIMVLFVIPRISTIYVDAGVKLPLMTRILLAISTFLSHYFLPIFFVLLGLVLIFDLVMQRSPKVRKIIHRQLLNIPVFGLMLKKLNIAMVSRSLSMLLQSGVPIDRSLLLAADTAQNASYRDALQWAEPLVSRGVHLTDVFRGRQDLFLPVFQRMVTTGEKSGNLDTMFANVAGYYDEDLEYWAANISSTIEPIMIVSVAVVVGCIAVAILFPLWNLVNVIN